MFGYFAWSTGSWGRRFTQVGGNVLATSTQQLDEAYHVELGGIETIPADQRHGHPRDLFTFWLATTSNFGAIVAGGIAPALGLDLWQSLLVVLIGSLSYVTVGAVSLYGPRYGLATLAISRLVFGARANRVNAFISWLLGLGWAAIGLAIGTLSFAAIVGYVMPHASPTLGKLAGLLVMSVLLYSASLFGHATIQAVEKYLAWVFAALVVAVAVVLVSRGVLSHIHAGSGIDPLSGAGVWATLAIGAMIFISSGGLGWAYMGAEYTRYLPQNTSPRRLAFLVSLGGAIPSLVLPMIGVVLALSGHFSNPIVDIPRLLPAWLGVPFLAFAILSTVAGYVPNLYSAALDFMVMGVKVRRQVSVTVVFAIALAGSLIAIFVYNFINSFETFLSLGVVWAAPWLAVFLGTLWLGRRNRTTGPGGIASLQASGGSAAIAGGLGFIVALLCSNDYPLWEGPVARALGGADISIYASAAVALVTLWLLERRRIARSAEPQAEDLQVRA